MGQNYNFNSTFGFNVTPRLKQEQQTKSKPKQQLNLENTIGNLFDSLTSYSPEAEKVYTGDIEKEINMYSRQAMFVAMNLRSAEDKRHFDVNI